MVEKILNTTTTYGKIRASHEGLLHSSTLKDLLGSFVSVGYRIPVPDFYLVLHGLCCRKSTIMD